MAYHPRISARSLLIRILISLIISLSVVLVAQGSGNYLLRAVEVLIGFGVASLFLMLPWTASLKFWSAVDRWLRDRRRR